MNNIKFKNLLCIASLGFTVLLTGCFGSDNDVNPEKTYRIVRIEGCEYIFVSRRPFGAEMALSHKGNCENPIHNHGTEAK